jgi:hypothetical protein
VLERAPVLELVAVAPGRAQAPELARARRVREPVLVPVPVPVPGRAMGRVPEAQQVVPVRAETGPAPAPIMVPQLGEAHRQRSPEAMRERAASRTTDWRVCGDAFSSPREAARRTVQTG